MYKNLQQTSKTVLRVEFITEKVYVRKKDMSQTNNLVGLPYKPRKHKVN